MERMNNLNKIIINRIIENALLEDINGIDIANEYISSLNIIGNGKVLIKEEGIVSGIDVFESVFKYLDEKIEIRKYIKDGECVKSGDIIAEVSGDIGKILQGERVALNLLQRMSGISTKAYNISKIVSGIDVKIVDTRKTTPGLRILEKYAVKMGGCYNHRYNLCDLVMLKDNHIKALGGIKKSIESIREMTAHSQRIEVEVESIKQFEEAIKTDVDIIMLDNMSIDDMKSCVDINHRISSETGKSKILEASGNITEDKLKEIANTGVDIISMGSLTHSVKSLDISFNLV